MKHSAAAIWGNCRRFWSREDGSVTIEALIWTPIFVVLMALTINVAQVFFHQSQILRVVQDTNRGVSLGRFANGAEAEAYITSALGYMTDEITVTSDIADGFVTTRVIVPALQLMPMRFLESYFEETNVTVVGSQLMEIKT